MCHQWHRLSIFLFQRKVVFRSGDIQVFVSLTSHYLSNLWHQDEYWCMRQGAFLNISFELRLINPPTWSIDRYKQEQYISKIFWTIWRTGAKFQALFNLATCTSSSVTNYVKFPVFHFFEKVNKREFKIVNISYWKFTDLIILLFH